jgi:dihydropteroate synthase
MIYKIGKKNFDFGSHAYVMGILNITPDSFFDGGKHFGFTNAIAHAKKLADDGADILDIGGESTRPGAEEISEAQEMERVLPVIETLIKEEYELPISIDTYKSNVADEACKRGAVLINDISGTTFDPFIIDIAKKHDAALVINHIKGQPRTMHAIEPQYTNVAKEIIEFFEEKIDLCLSKGFNKIILDPGIGFSKKLNHNLEVIKNLKKIKSLGYPILIALSRKRFIGDILKNSPNDRLFGTLAANSIAVFNGADIVRAHDAKETADAIKISKAISKPTNYKI